MPCRFPWFAYINNRRFVMDLILLQTGGSILGPKNKITIPVKMHNQRILPLKERDLASELQ